MSLKQRLLTIFLIAFSTSLLAFTPTAAQINQFKSLPKVQQEQLARQYGVDISAFVASASAAQEVVQKAPILRRTYTSVVQPQSDDLRPFGYDVLVGKAAGLTVVDDLPIPLDYQMGPGDEINVQMFGKSNQAMSLRIGRDGSVNIPSLGPLSVSGQTFGELKRHLTKVIKQKVIGVDVSVSMGSMRTMQVYIVGEAVQPGAYNVNALTTVTQALIASGGIKESGSLRNIQLKRKGKIISEFDLYDLLLQGDTSKDVRLSSGDTLFIPIKTRSVSVQGEVFRPAMYELKGETSMSQLLNLAGGTRPQAYLSKAGLRRVHAGLKQYTLDLEAPSGQEFLLKQGDQVNIGRVSSSLDNVISIRGEVVTQGAMVLTEGMRVSDVVGSIDEGLKDGADLEYALLVREKNEVQDIEVYQFSLLKALSEPGSQDDLLLQGRDQIFVFSNGLDLNYWADVNQNRSINGSTQSTQVRVASEYVDPETGAVVKNEAETALNTPDEDDISLSTRSRQKNREDLLEPIITRLKEQSSIGSPALLFEVSGLVRFPGVYPLTVNASVASLIEAAGGLKEEAYLDSAELTYRNLTDGRTELKQLTFSLADALSGKSTVSLYPQAHLAVKAKPDWSEVLTLELQGEVVFPGKYTFKRGDTIKDIIERAGGFTEFAYPKGAVFSRERLKRQEAERLKYLNAQLKQEISNMSLRSDGNVSDPSQAIAVLEQLGQAEPVGRLVINMTEAMAGNPLQNLILEQGDKLFIPALNPAISVVGEVQYASHHTYNPDLTVDEYIASSGGTKRQADTSRVYIVKANGSVEVPNRSFWFSRNYKPLEPGDAIIVPINTDYMNGLTTLSTATQVLYQLGVAWSAVKD
ncbi:SLBB domain-containing protein [Marinomonas sp. C2222]|uniref:SLBB domain-containing protein n=1 Tax=Marinomonas sargassi TaxID=2984494 RepID=A0ABT2YP37_9GAMM|nr:SLBB domain-containing protein [Marinomonas sargassi]MCV2401652.1 SLBB domain-containing protein [Marinomonas sargassi]